MAYAVLVGVTTVATVAVLVLLRDNPGCQTEPQKSTGKDTLSALLKGAPVRALVTLRIGLSFGKTCVITFLPIYARTAFDMSPFLVGGILAGGKLTKAHTQGVVGDYTDQFASKHGFIAIGALLYAGGTVLIPTAEFADAVFPAISIGLPAAVGTGVITLVPAFFALFGAYAVCGVADSIRLPASMATFVEEGKQFDAVAGSMSLRSVAWKVGQVAGPVSLGILWDATDVYTAFGVAGGFITFSTVVFLYLYSAEPATGRTVPGD